MQLRERARLDALEVELRVDPVGSDLARVELTPPRDERLVVRSPAESARPVAGRERGHLIEEEQLREPAGLQQPLAMPASKPEATCDPAPAVVPPADVS